MTRQPLVGYWSVWWWTWIMNTIGVTGTWIGSVPMDVSMLAFPNRLLHLTNDTLVWANNDGLFAVDSLGVRPWFSAAGVWDVTADGNDRMVVVGQDRFIYALSPNASRWTVSFGNPRAITHVGNSSNLLVLDRDNRALYLCNTTRSWLSPDCVWFGAGWPTGLWGDDHVLGYQLLTTTRFIVLSLYSESTFSSTQIVLWNVTDGAYLGELLTTTSPFRAWFFATVSAPRPAGDQVYVFGDDGGVDWSTMQLWNLSSSPTVTSTSMKRWETCTISSATYNSWITDGPDNSTGSCQPQFGSPSIRYGQVQMAYSRATDRLRFVAKNHASLVGAPLVLRMICPSQLTMIMGGFSNWTMCGCGRPGEIVSGGTCVSCQPGQWTPNTTSCASCPPGTYAPQASSICLSCQPGTYTSQFKSTVCSACMGGLWSGSGQSTCLICPRGNVSSTTSCVACSPGTMTNIDNQLTCANCTSGYYARDAGQTYCSLCVAGSATRSMIAASSCVECEAGSYSVSSGSTTCIVCPQGRYSNATGQVSLATCTLCAPGTFSDAGDARRSSCSACVPGKWTGGLGQFSCDPCEKGQFAADSGRSDCDSCRAGFFSEEQGSTGCEPCALGKWSHVNATTCLSCVLGRFSAILNATACIDCQEGTYSDTLASTACTMCWAGQWSTAAATMCQSCPPGTFGNSSSSHVGCQPCDKGTYSDQWGTTTCTLCLPGKYGPGGSATACSSCGAGSFTSTTMATACDECGAGSYSASVMATTCILCRPGSWSNSGVVATGCSLCSQGWFSATYGATLCQVCTAGSYSAEEGSSVCTSCSIGRFSIASASTCSACPVGTFTDTYGSSRCESCAVGFYASTTGLSACGPCPAGKYISTQGASECSWCGAGRYSAAEGATQCEDCVNRTVSRFDGQSTCETCVTGTIPSAHHQTCEPCPLGWFLLQPADQVCQECPPAFYMQSGLVACVPCAAGSSNNRSSALYCEVCAPGKYSGVQATTCSICTAGEYSMSVGATACRECTNGSFSSTGSSHCSTCGVGFYASVADSACYMCGAGTYSSSGGSTVCVTCPSDAVSANGASTCVSCEAGRYRVSASACYDCAPGTEPRSDLSTCVPCGIGTYRFASAACMECAVGFYSNATGWSSCEPCAAGFFSSTGASTCFGCPAGRMGHESTTGCITCEAGSYSASEASTRCWTCEAGSFSTLEGASTCELCRPGTFSAGAGSMVCQLCPSGTYSTINGSSACDLCDTCSVPGSYMSAALEERFSSLSIPDSAREEDVREAVVVDPLPDMKASYEIRALSARNGILIAVSGVVVVWTLVYYSLRRYPSVKSRLRSVDFFFDLNHYTANGEAVKRRQRALGGFCSLLSVVVALTATAVFVIHTFYLPTWSDGASPAISLPFSPHGQVKWQVELRGVAYGMCGQLYLQSDGNRVHSGESTGMVQTRTRQVTQSSCVVEWVCSDCVLSPAEILTIDLGARIDESFSAFVYAAEIRWILSLPAYTGSSTLVGIPERAYVMGGRMLTPEYGLYGFGTPMEVHVSMTPVLFNDFSNGEWWVGTCAVVSDAWEPQPWQSSTSPDSRVNSTTATTTTLVRLIVSPSLLVRKVESIPTSPLTFMVLCASSIGSLISMARCMLQGTETMNKEACLELRPKIRSCTSSCCSRFLDSCCRRHCCCTSPKKIILTSPKHSEISMLSTSNVTRV